MLLSTLSELPGLEVVDTDLLGSGERQHGVPQLLPGHAQPLCLRDQVTQLLTQPGPHLLGLHNTLSQSEIIKNTDFAV